MATSPDGESEIAADSTGKPGGPRPKAKARSRNKDPPDQSSSAAATDDGRDLEEGRLLEVDVDEVEEGEGEESAEPEETSLDKEEDQSDSEARVSKKKFGTRAKELRQDPFGVKKRRHKKLGVDLDFNDRIRTFEFTLDLRSVTVIGQGMFTFFAVELGPIRPDKHKDRVRLLPEFTPAYNLAKDETRTLPLLHSVFKRKHFSVSYAELKMHHMRVAMWCVSCWTFNTYHGVGTKTLWELAIHDANLEVPVKKSLSKKETSKKRAYDVGSVGCICNLQEVFDFSITCENWNLELETDHPLYSTFNEEAKGLTFFFPKDSGLKGFRSCTHATVEWKTQASAEGFYWATVSRSGAGAVLGFPFSGTNNHLKNAYFTVTVHSRKPSAMTKGKRMVLGGVIGKALFGLTSVLDVEVFQGKVKTYSNVKERFLIGVLNGNVRCEAKSKGYPRPETDIPGGRPQQRQGMRSVHDLVKGDRHLVVRVQKAINLPVADAETNSSDPYVKVMWDGMLQKSITLKATVKPVFGCSFYFPVRFFDSKLVTRFEGRHDKEKALVYEMDSKGPVQIDLFDEDETSSDFLGGFVLQISDILLSYTKKKANLLGPVEPKTVKPGDEDEYQESKPELWYEKQRDVRIFNAKPTELTASLLPNSEVPKLYFDAFFYPDLPEALKPDPSDMGDKDSRDVWKQKEKEFNREHIEFAQSYAQPFPNSIGALRCVELTAFSLEQVDLRRFPCIGVDTQQSTNIASVPLMAYLVRIIAPEKYTAAPMLLHWTNCFPFAAAARQANHGLIQADLWNPPQRLLDRRIGSAQDHAIFLCSLLLGCKREAYVVKGTVWVTDTVRTDKKGHKQTKKRLVEHTWVMTREKNNYVTFWEPCTREVYHLPQRWSSHLHKSHVEDKAHKSAESGDAETTEIVAASAEEGDAPAWTDEVQDVQITTEEFEHLPTVGRMPKAKARVDPNRANAKAMSRKNYEDKLVKQREKLVTAPRPALLTDQTLVDWLPYDSIEVVFNERNVWANRQNHHPACIRYDFDNGDKESPQNWSPLVKDLKDPTFKYRPLRTSVNFEPPTEPVHRERMLRNLVSEVKENIEMFRGGLGWDTVFDSNEELGGLALQCMKVHEFRRSLDIDFCPLWKKPTETWDSVDSYVSEKLHCQKQYNRHGSPWQDDIEYVISQKEKWKKLYEEVHQFLHRYKKFPFADGKVFKGFPVHFCTADKSAICGYLASLEEYKDFMQVETAKYIIKGHITPLLGGVQSVWLYIGYQYEQKAKR